MASVSATVSVVFMPRSTMAIAIAATWPSLQLPCVRPCTKASICAGASAPPSRLVRISSWASITGAPDSAAPGGPAQR